MEFWGKVVKKEQAKVKATNGIVEDRIHEMVKNLFSGKPAKPIDAEDDKDRLEEEAAVSGMKRPSQSSSKTPATGKKAKLIYPVGQKNGGNGRKGAHTATRHPAKIGKAPAKNSHPEAAKFRDVPVKYYDELSLIFGKDRATGSFAEAPADMIEDLANQEANDTIGTSQIPNPAVSNDSDATSRRQKRKRADDTNVFVEGVQSAARILATEIRESSCRLSRALGEEASEHQKMIYDELKKLPGLTMTERHKAHFIIGCDSSKLNLFFSVPGEERENWVKSLLDFA